MDISLAGTGITYRPDDDQLSGLSISFAAFDGEIGTGTLPVPDPTAAISVYDGRAVRIEEGSTRLTDGYIIDQDRDRGPQPAATARVHTFSIQDANALLDGFRILSRLRPAETDYARVMAFAAADGPSWDTTWVLNTETVTMPAKLYSSDGGWTSELIPDLVEFTGKTLWLHDLADGSGRCLHYHNLTSGHGCGLEITDVIPDVDYVTTWFPWSPRRQRTSVDLRNDVVGKDQTGRTSAATDATSISRHDADGLQHQSLQQFEAVSQADLDIKTSAYLASQKDERDTWTCQIGPLDEDALALIRVGDIITVTSSVMGLTASDQRIAHMTLSPAIGEGGRAADGFWMATLEMGAPVRRRRRRAAKSFVDRIEHTPIERVIPWVLCGPGNVTGDPELLESASFPYTLIPAVMDGDDVVLTGDGGGAAGKGGFTGGPGTSTIYGELSGMLYIGPIVGSVASTSIHVLVGAGGFNVRQNNFPTPHVQVFDEDTSSEVYLFPTGLTGFFNYRYLNVPPPDASFAYLKFWQAGTGPEPPAWRACGAISSAGSGLELDVRSGDLGDVWTMTWEHPSWCEYPESGIPGILTYDDGPTGWHWTRYGPVPSIETADGSTSTFTIPPYPGGGYMPGTLIAYVDGVVQNATETDPAAGIFDLPWTPALGDEVKASWLVP